MVKNEPAEPEVVLIIGGGPGISASCARHCSAAGMRVAVAARNPDKPALQKLTDQYGVRCYRCDAADADAVSQLFDTVKAELGVPTLVIHNIDGRMEGIFRKSAVDADPVLVQQVMQNSAYSAFLVGQQAATTMLTRTPRNPDGHRGTLIFTNASAAFRGYAKSAAFAMASHAKAGLAQSLARELMPQGIHVAHVPIDAAIGWTREDGRRAHWLAGDSEADNMADPDHIAALYLQLHQQHRSTWAFEVVLRPWTETW